MTRRANKVDFSGWWILVWSNYRGNPMGFGGAITHAMDNDGNIACGRTLFSPDSGAASDDDEAVMPCCKACRKRVERDRASLQAKKLEDGGMEKEKPHLIPDAH